MNKKLLEQLVEKECEKQFLEEDISSFVKSLLGKTKSAASNTWTKVKKTISSAVSKATKTLLKKISKIEKAIPVAMKDYKDLKALEKEVGEEVDKGALIKQAKELEAFSTQIHNELSSELKSVEKLEKSNEETALAQEAYARRLEEIISESFNEKNEGQLNEVLDPFSITGIVLGAIGGIPLLLKGLKKMASFLKLEKVASAFGKAYEVAHKFEDIAVDNIVPDKLSYAWYKKTLQTVSKSKEPLSFEDYKNNVNGIRAKVEKKIYAIVLIPFLLSGVAGMLKAGTSLVGVAEGAASTVKAVEIGEAVAELAAAVSSISEL